MTCKYLKLALLTLMSVMSWVSYAQTGEISVLEDTLILDKAVVRAVMPKTKITGNSMITTIKGTVLSNSGTAHEILS